MSLGSTNHERFHLPAVVGTVVAVFGVYAVIGAATGIGSPVVALGVYVGIRRLFGRRRGH